MSLKFNATIRWIKSSQRWAADCEICWDGPKSKYGQGFSTECSTKGRAVAAVSLHIIAKHSQTPVVYTLAPKENPRPSCPAWPGCACILRGVKDADCHPPYGSSVMGPKEGR